VYVLHEEDEIAIAGRWCLGVYQRPAAPDPGAQLCGAADYVGEKTGVESRPSCSIATPTRASSATVRSG
jgi:hypothetical protein